MWYKMDGPVEKNGSSGGERVLGTGVGEGEGSGDLAVMSCSFWTIRHYHSQEEAFKIKIKRGRLTSYWAANPLKQIH